MSNRVPRKQTSAGSMGENGREGPCGSKGGTLRRDIPEVFQRTTGTSVTVWCQVYIRQRQPAGKAISAMFSEDAMPQV